MPSRNRGKGARDRALLRDLSHKKLSKDEIREWAKEAQEGSDRSCALVLCAYIDHALRDLIITYLVPDEAAQNRLLSDDGAPVFDLGARIHLAHALGAIGDTTRTDLQAMRLIRNAFAHAPRRVDFENKALVALLDDIEDPEVLYTDAGGGPGRAKFVSTAVETAIQLMNAGTNRMNSKKIGQALLASQTPSPDTLQSELLREAQNESSSQKKK